MNQENNNTKTLISWIGRDGKERAIPENMTCIFKDLEGDLCPYTMLSVSDGALVSIARLDRSYFEFFVQLYSDMGKIVVAQKEGDSEVSPEPDPED